MSVRKEVSTIERILSFQCFGSESLSDIMSSFTLPESGQMATALCPRDLPSTNELSSEENFKAKKRKKVPEHCAVQSNPPLNGEAEQQKDVSIETVKISMDKDKKRQESESGKEDYIHIRAKGGQATNSHSLAERVRREKISRRMRLLQDLVPGCNKITGKAVMLDEIINYVQSLQRQVEFLSMKLAAVNPEINLDIEQNLQSMRYGSLSAFGYGLEMGTSHPNSRDFLRNANPCTSPMPQVSNSWDQEFQNALQMGWR